MDDRKKNKIKIQFICHAHYTRSVHWSGHALARTRNTHIHSTHSHCVGFGPSFSIHCVAENKNRKQKIRKPLQLARLDISLKNISFIGQHARQPYAVACHSIVYRLIYPARSLSFRSISFSSVWKNGMARSTRQRALIFWRRKLEKWNDLYIQVSRWFCCSSVASIKWLWHSTRRR